MSKCIIAYKWLMFLVYIEMDAISFEYSPSSASCCFIHKQRVHPPLHTQSELYISALNVHAVCWRVHCPLHTISELLTTDLNVHAVVKDFNVNLRTNPKLYTSALNAHIVCKRVPCSFIHKDENCTLRY